MAAAGALPELLGLLGRFVVRCSLQLCCVPEETIEGIERRHMQRDSGARLICYLDGVSDELVKRQLEFRRTRKIERSASRTSLSSLDPVSEDSPFHSLVQDVPTLRRNVSTPTMSSAQLYSDPGLNGGGRLRSSSSVALGPDLILDQKPRRDIVFGR